MATPKRAPCWLAARRAPSTLILLPAGAFGKLASTLRPRHVAIDPDMSSGASNSFDYSQRNDEQLRSAIRFAEKLLRWVEEDHVTLLRAYREEIDAMRRHPIDRMLRRNPCSRASRER